MRHEMTSLPSRASSGWRSKARSTGRNWLSAFGLSRMPAPAAALAASAQTKTIALVGNIARDPVEIRLVAPFHADRDDFGKFVGMMLQHGLFERLEVRRAGLDDEQCLIVMLNRAFPAIHRPDRRHDVHARSMAALD